MDANLRTRTGDASAKVGELVRERRQAAGLSLQDLAERVGCGKGYLSEVETGRRGAPGEDVLGRIEEALMFPRGRLLAAAAWERMGSGEGGARVRRELEDAAKSRRVVERLRELMKQGGLDGAYRSGELAKLVGEAETAGASVLPIRLSLEVPLINKVAAGYPREFTDLGYPARVADEYVKCPELDDPDAFAARVVGDSMEPQYREGDVVVFSPSRVVKDGMDVFARLEPDHETTFKRVFFERAGDGKANTEDAEGEVGGDRKTARDGGRDPKPRAVTHVRLQPLNAKYPPRVVERERVAGLYAAVTVMRRV